WAGAGRAVLPALSGRGRAIPTALWPGRTAFGPGRSPFGPARTSVPRALVIPGVPAALGREAGGRDLDAGRPLPQELGLGARQRTVLAGRQPFQDHRADGDPGQAHDLVAELGEHPADLTLLALGQDQLQYGGLALGADHPGPLGPDLAVRQPDPLGQL